MKTLQLDEEHAIFPEDGDCFAAMGAALIISQRGYNLGAALLFALFGGLGATIALISFAGLRLDLNVDGCPKSFRGAPLELITAGLMALSLVGFYGLHLA